MIMNVHMQPSHCIPLHSVACAGLPDPRYMGHSGGYVDRRTHACHGMSSQATCEMYMATLHMHMAYIWTEALHGGGRINTRTK